MIYGVKWNLIGIIFGDDLIKWINRFENEIIFRVVTGIKNDAIASYYYTITPENNNNEKKLKESENFVKSIEIYLEGLIYFFSLSKFIRHNFPLIR